MTLLLHPHFIFEACMQLPGRGGGGLGVVVVVKTVYSCVHVYAGKQLHAQNLTHLLVNHHALVVAQTQQYCFIFASSGFGKSLLIFQPFPNETTCLEAPFGVFLS